MTIAKAAYFTPDLFRFLSELKSHNTVVSRNPLLVSKGLEMASG